MRVVILCGLLSSTALNVFFVLHCSDSSAR